MIQKSKGGNSYGSNNYRIRTVNRDFERIQTQKLMTVEVVVQLIAYQEFKSEIGRYRSSYLYRGMPNVSYGLLTTLQRNCGQKQNMIVKSILRSFSKYAVSEGSLDQRIHMASNGYWTTSWIADTFARLNLFSLGCPLLYHSWREPRSDGRTRLRRVENRYWWVPCFVATTIPPKLGRWPCVPLYGWHAWGTHQGSKELRQWHGRSIPCVSGTSFHWSENH